MKARASLPAQAPPAGRRRGKRKSPLAQAIVQTPDDVMHELGRFQWPGEVELDVEGEFGTPQQRLGPG
jgi:hypothetical protein